MVNSINSHFKHEKDVGVWGPLPKTLTLFMTKNLRFPLPYLWPDQKFDTQFMTWYRISYQNGSQCLKSIPYLWPKRMKTIPFGAAHTYRYIAHIREYPPPPQPQDCHVLFQNILRANVNTKTTLARVWIEQQKRNFSHNMIHKEQLSRKILLLLNLQLQLYYYFSPEYSWSSSCSDHEIVCDCVVFHCGLLCPTKQSNKHDKTNNKRIYTMQNTKFS